MYRSKKMDDQGQGIDCLYLFYLVINIYVNKLGF